MKQLIHIFFVLIPAISLGQGFLLPLEKSTAQDYVMRALYNSNDNQLITINNHNYRRDFNFSSTQMVSSSLIVYDLTNRTKIRKDFYSTYDSISLLNDIVESNNYDTIRYISSFNNTGNILNSQYFYHLTNDRFDFDTEVPLNLPVSINEIYNSYELNNKLYFSGFRDINNFMAYDFVYDFSTRITSVVDSSFLLTGIGPTIYTNDSLKIKVKDI